MAWLLKGIVEYYLESSFIRLFHVRCGRQYFNLWADVRGDPNIGNVLHKVFCLEICATFSRDAIQDSNILLVPLNVSMEEITAWTVGYSTITEAKRLVCLSIGFNCSRDVVSLSFKHMLGLWGCCCWLLWGRWLIKGSDCKVFLSA